MKEFRPFALGVTEEDDGDEREECLLYPESLFSSKFSERDSGSTWLIEQLGIGIVALLCAQSLLALPLGKSDLNYSA